MNKAELINTIAERTELSKKSAGDVLNAFTSIVTEELSKGETVQLIGFGTFETRERAERTGRNPRTGEEMKISACRVPAFKAGKQFRNAVND